MACVPQLPIGRWEEMLSRRRRIRGSEGTCWETSLGGISGRKPWGGHPILGLQKAKIAQFRGHSLCVPPPPLSNADCRGQEGAPERVSAPRKIQTWHWGAADGHLATAKGPPGPLFGPSKYLAGALSCLRRHHQDARRPGCGVPLQIPRRERQLTAHRGASWPQFLPQARTYGALLESPAWPLVFRCEAREDCGVLL